MEELKVSRLSEPQRLDVFLSRETHLTRAKIKNLLDEGGVLLNGSILRKAGQLLRGGEVVTFERPSPKPSTLQAESIPLEILFEDEFLLVINKPPGLVVHPAAGHWTGTLVNALLHHFKKLSGVDPARPGIVHRLDKDTSGILLIAKTDEVHVALSRMLKERKIEKTYQVLVFGKVPHQEGVIRKPIGRHPSNRKKMAIVSSGREAVTHFKVRERFKNYTLLECRIETGRTHQIRVHLAGIGHAVVGDTLYGRRENPLDVKRQLLHAWRIRLEHPATKKELLVEAPLPEDFQKTLVLCGLSG